MNEMDSLVPHLRLQLNLKHPDLEECYLFGFESAREGLEESENPFPSQSKENFYWQEGYWDGYYDEKPLFSTEKPKTETQVEPDASNDKNFIKPSTLMLNVFKITSALAATFLVGYQVFDLVA